MEAKEITQEKLEKILKTEKYIKENIKPYSFIEVAAKLERVNSDKIKIKNINKFFDENEYDRIYTSIELFREIKNRLKLDFREDPYAPVNKLFCIRGNKYDEIIVEDFKPYKK